jgi:hypothetical protein
MSENDAPEGFVTLFNPATGDPWNCPEGAVDGWLDLGWKKTAPNKEAAKAAKELSPNG